MIRLTIEEAKAQGFTVDSHCYPHIGYMGPRFDPTKTVGVLTECEAHLIALVRSYLEVCPAFRSRPMGQAGSAVRIQQDLHIATEEAAKASIALFTGVAP